MKEENVIMILESLMSESSRRFSDIEKTMKIKTWTMALNDISDEQGMIGFEKAIKNPNEFMLSSGQFRELCVSGNESLESDGNISWALVMKNLNSYIRPVFKDSCISETIRQLGGWGNICLMETKEEPFRKQDFIQNYQSIRRRGKEYNPALSWHSRREKKFIGYDSKEEIENAKLKIENIEKSESKMLGILAGKQDG